MAKGKYNAYIGQGRCRACRTPFVGPGEHCQKCKQALLERKRRKPR